MTYTLTKVRKNLSPENVFEVGGVFLTLIAITPESTDLFAEWLTRYGFDVDPKAFTIVIMDPEERWIKCRFDLAPGIRDAYSPSATPSGASSSCIVAAIAHAAADAHVMRVLNVATDRSGRATRSSCSPCRTPTTLATTQTGDCGDGQSRTHHSATPAPS